MRPFVLILASCLLLGACSSAEERAEQHYQSALSLVSEGDIDRAIVELRNVFQNEGNHFEARQLIAELLLNEKSDPRAAYGQYLRLAEQYPEDLGARLALAYIAAQAADWAEVKRHGEQAVKLAPEDARVQPVLLYLNYREATLAEEVTRHEGVAAQALELLEAGGNDSLLMSVVTDANLRQGNFTSALGWTDKLLEKHTSNLLYWRQKLNILAQMRASDEIAEHLRKMVAQFPDIDENKATLLRFYISRGELDEAEAFLRELAEASTENGPKIDLVRFLNETRGAGVAREELNRFLSEVENNAPFRAFLAGLDFGGGQQDKAIADMEALITESEPSPERDDYTVALARMLRLTGNRVGARARIEEVLSVNPNHVSALKMQAVGLIERDSADEAISALRTVLSSRPEDVEALNLMATAYTRIGQSNLARDFMARSVEASGNSPAESIRYAQFLVNEESFLPAEDILISALRLSPQNIGVLEMLGRVYLSLDDMSRLQGVSSALLQLEDPNAETIANGFEAERLNREQGPEYALAFLERSAENSEDQTRAQINLVRARMATGDTESALQLARQLAAEDTTNETLKVVQAATENVAGNLQEAADIYREVLDKSPNQTRIWLRLINVEQRLGNVDSAANLLAQGLELNPDSADLLWAQASAHEQQGDFEAAIAIYEDLYQRDSSGVVVANNLASLITTHREDPESLERAWQVARRFANVEVPALQDTYGWILHRRGENENALPYMEAAAKGLPNDPQVSYHLAKVYVALGRPDDARFYFERAVNLAGPADPRPQFDEARQFLQQTNNSSDSVEETVPQATD